MLYRNGTVCGSYELKTADTVVELFSEEYTADLKADGQDIVFLTVGMRDRNGNINLQEEKEIRVCVEGVGVLQGYGSSDPAAEESYQSTVCHTFDGYVQAAVRSVGKEGMIRVTFSTDGCASLRIALRSRA